MNYAIIQTSGKQYKVTKDQELLLEKVAVPEGKSITFDQVYLLARDKKITIGAPIIKGAKVTAKVLSHQKGPKIRVATYRAKSKYRKVKGHRQHLTRVKITSIVGRENK